MDKLPITVAVTGASGAPYTLRLLEQLLKAGYPLYVMFSKAALVVFATESDCKLSAKPKVLAAQLSDMFDVPPEQLQVFAEQDWFAPVASGSAKNGPMIVCPCSMGSVSAIAAGASNNLIERAADVAIKEARKLILVPREMPFSAIHLENLTKLAKIGVIIMPASPGFYHQPESIDDMVDFVVARLLDHLGVEHSLAQRWGQGYQL